MSTDLIIYILIAIIAILILALLVSHFLVAKKTQKNQFNASLAHNKLFSSLEKANDYISLQKKQHSDDEKAQQELQHKFQCLNTEYQNTCQKLARQTAYAEQVSVLENKIQLLETKNEHLQNDYNDILVRAEKLETKLIEDQESAQEKINLLLSTKDELKLQFQQLANSILEEKSKNFLEQNQQHLNHILSPLNEKMQGFSKLVQDTYEKEAKERTTIGNELKRLQELNNRLNHEASALTQALTGNNNKIQGTWGEMILEKVLENSGLRKNIEYKTQQSVTLNNEEGHKRYQPDVIIYLPEKKHIIIDSKVSLNAYIDYINSDTDEQRKEALKKHTLSLRRHIKGLAEKNYQDILPLGQNLDYVLMFVPIEPAYLAALQEDDSIFQYGFDQQIILVCPSTLLAMLRTIAGIWRFEQQNNNALEIASRAGKMLDKFNAFLENLRKVGDNINKAQLSYQSAVNQLREGKNSLSSQAERIKSLGAQSKKEIPDDFASNERMLLEDDEPNEQHDGQHDE